MPKAMIYSKLAFGVLTENFLGIMAVAVVPMTCRISN